MNPVRAALRYPQVTLFLSAVVFLVGVYSMARMSRREDPNITIRTGVVAAYYPGATSQEVEDQVTRKIEENLFHFAEVRREKTYSTSMNGMVVVNVELNKWVQNSDEFWSRLRLDMAQLKLTDLPSNVQGPIVDMVPAILRVVFQHEDRRVVPVGTVRHRLQPLDRPRGHCRQRKRSASANPGASPQCGHSAAAAKRIAASARRCRSRALSQSRRTRAEIRRRETGRDSQA